MHTRALKFYHNAVFHLHLVRSQYTNFLKSINIPKSKPLSVLDIGIGSGRIFYEAILPLLPRNVTEIIACDMEPEMIEFCRTLNYDERVTFEKLNITDENLPKHLHKRFDIIFSSFCFSYLKDLRRGFENTGKLLKPDGELMNIFQYKKNGLFTTYRRMSELDKWKSYTGNYATYKTNLSGPNPDVELKKIFKDIGMTLVKYEFIPEYFMPMTKTNIWEAYRAMDSVYSQIPDDQKEEYIRDFKSIFSEEVEVDFHDESNSDQIFELSFPTVVVQARN